MQYRGVLLEVDQWQTTGLESLPDDASNFDNILG